MASGTRAALVEAAAALMDAGGLEAVTLREVGRLAGVSRGAPYKHFADKEALLAAVGEVPCGDAVIIQGPAALCA